MLIKKRKDVIVSNVPVNFKPYKDDYPDIDRLAKAWGKSRPEVTRELVSEALKARRLKKVGKDEATDEVVRVQKNAMLEALAPVTEQLLTLTEQTKTVRRELSRVQGLLVDELENVARRENFLVQCARFIAFEVIVCRILLRDYVHTAYKVFVAATGRPVNEIEQNFKKRLAGYQREANTLLDNLTERGADRLYKLAEEGNFSRE